jgi:hypothetical protein
VTAPGVFEVSVGGKQPDFSGIANANSTGVVSGRFEVVVKVASVQDRGTLELAHIPYDYRSCIRHGNVALQHV